MKKFLIRALAIIATVALLGTIGPVQRVIAQGVVHLTTFTGTTQITGVGYPCTVSCYVTFADIATYVNGLTGGVNAQTGTSYTVASTDPGKVITFSNTGSVAVTLPQATTAGFGSGQIFNLSNVSTGVVTVTPTTSTINGAASLTIEPNRTVELVSDGANYFISVGTAALQTTPALISEGGTGSSTAATARTALAVPGLATANTYTAGLQQLGSASGVPVHTATAQTTAPALTSCGTGSPAITGTDTAGIVTMGTTATGCIITFNVAYTGTPFCVVTWIATPLASQSYVTANTAITLTQTSTSGNKAQYICTAPSGG